MYKNNYLKLIIIPLIMTLRCKINFNYFLKTIKFENDYLQSN